MVSGFVKAQGTISAQQGTSYGDEEENRENITIRADDIFTVTVTTSDTGADVVDPEIPPGTYGWVTVHSNDQLTLTSAGAYNFVGLTLEPGSALNLPQTGLTQINVHSNLILRSPMSTAGDLVVTYAGTNPVHIENPFNGSLFIAPNATVEVKSGADFGSFFAKRIEVHQEIRITRRPLSEAVQALFLPSPSVHQLDEVAPSSMYGHAEIASAILTPSIASCTGTNPMAFVSHQSSDVLRASIDLGASFFNGVDLPRLPVSSTVPGLCFGSPLQGYPNPDDTFLYEYPTLPPMGGFPRPYYTVSPYTDNVMSRTTDGRVLELGFAFRSCEDVPDTSATPSGACPGTLPDGPWVGVKDPDSCDATANMYPCFYANPDPDKFPGAEDMVCKCVSDVTDNWLCTLRRVDATGLSLRMSSDCGNTWSSQYLDMFSLGLLSGNEGGGTIDRPELYVDPYADRLFVSGSMTPVFGDLNAEGALSVMVVGTPKSAATADTVNFSVYKQDPWDGGPAVMTTVPDDQARLDDGTLGSYVYVVRAHCAGPLPLVEVETPFGWKMVDLSQDLGDDFQCRLAVEPSVPIVNHVPNITVTGIPSVPPKVRIAYPALNPTGQQIVQVFVVTLRSTGGYSNLQNEAKLELTVTPEASTAHAFFPQLIPVDGVAGSDGRGDTPTVLRYAELTGQEIDEKAIVLYSGMRSDSVVVGHSSLGAMFGTACGVFNPMTSNYPISCSIGDYRYGAFFEKEGTTLRYFTPWSGEAAGKAGIHAIGATLDVVPN